MGKVVAFSIGLSSNKRIKEFTLSEKRADYTHIHISILIERLKTGMYIDSFTIKCLRGEEVLGLKRE